MSQLSQGAPKSVIRMGEREIDLTSGEVLGWTAAGVATLGIVIALISQYGFGWEPCQLCLWQRYPYYVGLGLAAPALFWGVERRWLFAAAGLVFAIGAAIALYHSLVELQVLEGLASCSADPGGMPSSFEEFVKETENEVIVDCGVRTPYFLGMTMTNLNLVVSSDIATVFGLAAWRSGR